MEQPELNPTPIAPVEEQIPIPQPYTPIDVSVTDNATTATEDVAIPVEKKEDAVEQAVASIAEIAANILDSDSLIHQIPVDSIVKSVLSKFVSRAEFGMKKYGTSLDRKDLQILDWIQHAQEEHMDAILYLEKLKQTVSQTST